MTEQTAAERELAAPGFAVVIPAYNEEAGIERCVREVAAALAKLPNRSELIVVDDGSSDGTGAILGRLEGSIPGLVAVRHSENRGYGAALRTGSRIASEDGLDYVLFMDSDLTNDPAYLDAFAARMAEGADVIKASRYSGGGGSHGVPRWRVAVSVVGNGLARRLFGLPIRDCTNGFRAVRTTLFEGLQLEQNGFALIMEELYRLKPVARSYAEVPIVLKAREAGLRPSVFSYSVRSLGTMLKYPLLSAWQSISRQQRKQAAA